VQPAEAVLNKQEGRPHVKTFDDTSSFRLQIDAHQCRLSDAELARLRAEVNELASQVDAFPVSDFHVLIEHNNRSNDYSVKVTLVLPGTRLVGNDHDPALHAAFERCLASLTENVRAYKDRLGRVEARQKAEKGTIQEVLPGPAPDEAAVRDAVDNDDYAAFRAALLVYEEPLRKRIGRWIERYPDVNAAIGRTLTVSDVVEEVFLLAFEEYPRRRRELRLGEWMEGLIDSAVRALRDGGDEELQNVNRSRSAVEAERGPGIV
jgi:ribosome-associated translation inhibitor RaiA